MNYKECHAYLDSLLIFGIKLGLENMKVLCDLLNNPQQDLKFIHVAGTNGKGSCCAMLAAALKKGGLKTGFYSSPFLYRFTERWRINGKEVSEGQVARAISQIAALEPRLTEITGARPTYFEVLTAAALLIFQDASVEIVVWETGMGGRLDATNVVTPLVSVITSIDLDHTHYLGDTLAKVAVEKGGIIKPQVTLVSGEIRPQVVDYFSQLARQLKADCRFFATDYFIESSELRKESGEYYRDIVFNSSKTVNLKLRLPTIAAYQCKNAAIAIATLEIVCDKLGLSFLDTVLGIEKYIWPGRMELRENGILLDGAHNPSGVRVLLNTLDEMNPGLKVNFFFAASSDKNWQEMLDILSPKAESFYFVRMNNKRSCHVEKLQSYAQKKGIRVKGCGTSTEALASIKQTDKAVFAGSLYLIGEALFILNKGKPALVDSL